MTNKELAEKIVDHVFNSLDRDCDWHIGRDHVINEVSKMLSAQDRGAGREVVDFRSSALRYLEKMGIDGIAHNSGSTKTLVRLFGEPKDEYIDHRLWELLETLATELMAERYKAMAAEPSQPEGMERSNALEP